MWWLLQFLHFWFCFVKNVAIIFLTFIVGFVTVGLLQILYFWSGLLHFLLFWFGLLQILHFWSSLLHFWFVTFLVWFVTNVAIGRLPHPRSPLIPRCPIVYLPEKKPKEAFENRPIHFQFISLQRKAFENRPIHFQFISLLGGFETICGQIAASVTLFLNSTKCVLIANTISFKINIWPQFFKLDDQSF